MIEIDRVDIRFTDHTTISIFGRSGNAEVRAHFPSGEQHGETERMTIEDLLAVCVQLKAASSRPAVSETEERPISLSEDSTNG